MNVLGRAISTGTALKKLTDLLLRPNKKMSSLPGKLSERGLMLAVCACLGMPLLAEGNLKTTQQLEQGKPAKIVCFGDSITGVYYHTGGVRAWSHLLEHALKIAYPHAQLEVINAGVSGNTTTAALARMEADVLSRKPNLVAIMFGMNDTLRVSPSEYRDNLKELVARAVGQGVEVILMTPNTIHAGDARWSPERVGEYAGIVRQVGKELGVPVADCFGRYQAEADKDRQAWVRLMSDMVHPNLHGHKLFAEEVARIIVGEKVSLADLPPALSDFPKIRARLKSGEEVRVVAMQPYDVIVRQVLQTLYPKAQLQITPWEVAGKSFATIIEEAKQKGWWRLQTDPAWERPHLVILAVPNELHAESEEAYFRDYSAVLNWSLSYGEPQWELLAVLPSVAELEQGQASRRAEAIAVDVVTGSDSAYLQRLPGEISPPSELLLRCLQAR